AFLLGVIIISNQFVNAEDQIFNPELLPQEASYHFVWEKAGKNIGDTTFSVKKTQDGTFLIKTTGLENTSVLVNDQNLKPIKAFRKIELGGQEFSVSGDFKNNVVNVKAKTPEGAQNVTVDIPDNTYHNDSLLMSVMAMEMDKKKKISFKHYNPANSYVGDYSVSVIGEEKVTVPAGTFDTFHLKLDYLNGKSIHDAWYEKSVPHKLVKYINKDAGTIGRLSK
ncbi:MAG: DUF3108 domain-containing protein, partial [Cyanobacteriota bacterium]